MAGVSASLREDLTLQANTGALLLPAISSSNLQWFGSWVLKTALPWPEPALSSLL